MQRVVLILVLLLGVNKVDGGNKVGANTLKGWVKEVFKNINALPLLKKPGRLLTYGDAAFPAILGNTEADAFMALAELDKGRVAAFARSQYVWNILGNEKDATIVKLHSNLRSWLSKGGCSSNDCICKPNDSKSLGKYLADKKINIVLWYEGDWSSEEDNDKLSEWVSGGGALLHGFTAQNWLIEAGRKSVLELGLYKPVSKAGIVYLPETANFPNSMPTNKISIDKLMNANINQVAKSITFKNLAKNEMVQSLLDLIQKKQNYFPSAIAAEILGPFVSFAKSQEKSMTWPVATVGNNKNFVYVSKEQHAMFKLYYALGTVNLWKRKAPSVELFPGDITGKVTTTSGSFTFQSKQNTEYFPTGMYLLPDQKLTVEILNKKNDNSWREFSLMIGSHTDCLTDLDMLARWPVIYREVQLMERSFTVRWMFGGLVYIKGPIGKGNTLKISLSGAIPTPFYNLNDPKSIKNWKTSRKAPGLVADITGKRMRYTVPSDKVRNLPDPGGNMKTWDKIVEKAYRVYEYPSTHDRQEWATSDIQITKGAMHSGYPIGRYIDEGEDYVFNGDWEGQWGMYHEIGHNLANDIWRWVGNSELVNNVVSMMNVERLTNRHDWPIPKIQDNINRCLADFLKKPSFPGDSKCGLLVYSQTIRDFGWNCQHQVFASYQEDQKADKNIPINDKERINQWVMRWSEAVKYNLIPLFGDFWRWPVDSKTTKALSSLPPYFPDDLITQDPGAEKYVKSIIKKYPKLLRKIKKMPKCPFFKMD